MSEISSALGMPVAFAFEGKQYAVYERTLDMEGLIEQAVADRQLEMIRRWRDKLGPDWKDALANWQEGLGTDFAWGGKVCVKYLSSEAGLKHLALLHLSGNHRPGLPVDMKLIDRIWNDEGALAELFARINQANGGPHDPKATGGGEKTSAATPSPS